MGVASTPEHIIRDRSLSLGAKATWGVLASHSDGFYGNQSVWPSQDTIADHLGMTARAVRNWIGELEAAGHLHVIRQNTHAGRESNVYVLHFPQRESPQEAHRNERSSGVPMGYASPQEPQWKPAGTPVEPQWNGGSSKGLEGSEGREGLEDLPARGKPEQATMFEPPAKQDKKPRAKKPPSDNTVAFDSAWSIWERVAIPAGHVKVKPDGRLYAVVAAAVNRLGLAQFEQVLRWHVETNAKAYSPRLYTIQAWCAGNVLPVTEQAFENAKSGNVSATRQPDNRLQGAKPPELPKWN